MAVRIRGDGCVVLQGVLTRATFWIKDCREVGRPNIEYAKKASAFLVRWLAFTGNYLYLTAASCTGIVWLQQQSGCASNLGNANDRKSIKLDNF